MNTKDKIIAAALMLIAFGCSIYLIRSILSPFVFSLIVAYFLHPLMDYLSCKKISRFASAWLIIGAFFVVLFGIIALTAPIIYSQGGAFIEALPQYFQTIVEDIYPKCAAFLNSIGILVNGDLLQVIDDANLDSKMLDFLQNFAISAFSSSVAFINILSLIFITPILIFYLLKDWNLLASKVKSYMPSRIAFAGGKIMEEIDDAMAGYIRGQISVCLILSFIYSILLTLAGLNFGFLIGFVTGLITFVPYVGALTGFVVAILIALFQWGFDFASLITIVGVFVFCQMLESNYLTPKLIGKNIGLHPVWIIFGLFVFGVLFGFIGILFATPLTAVCSVFVKHLSFEYKKHIS